MPITKLPLKPRRKGKNLQRRLSAERLTSAFKSPSRLDPSRTLILRKALGREVSKRFRRLRYEIRKLVIEDDAFGLKADAKASLLGNVFCATGEGGGVDPSCGGKSRLSSKEEQALVDYTLDSGEANAGAVRELMLTGRGSNLVAESVEHLKSAMEKLPTVEGIVYRGIPFRTRSERALIVGRVSRTKEYSENAFASGTQSRETAEEFASSKHPLLLAIKAKTAKDVSSYSVEPAQKEVFLQPGVRYKFIKQESGAGDSVVLHLEELSVDKRPTHNTRWRFNTFIVDDDAFGLKADSKAALLGNSFCPTGPGGGIDPSCSPHGGHRAVVDVTKAFGHMGEVEFVTDDSGKAYGEHGSKATVVNPHLATGRPVSLNFKPASGVTEAHHLAAHELVHQVFSNHNEASHEAMNSLAKVKGPYGSAVSVYGAFEGPLENVIELGAAYAHSPSQLKEFSPEMYSIADRWARKVKAASVANKAALLGGSPTANTRWRFESSPNKLKQFQNWLKVQMAETIKGKDMDALLEKYAEDGFRKGLSRSYDDVKKVDKALSSAAKEEGKLDFYRGSKSEFLQSAFRQPESIEKIKLLAGRSFTDLEGVTEEMSTRMSRSLVDGLVQGKNPLDIAKDLDEDLDIGLARAQTIARTEIIRAHAEGQLDALEDLGVEEVGVAVEWSTADDEHVCPLCEPLEGVVLKVDEARGLLPRHPNCRCAWLPANMGEDDKEQKRSKKEIDSAFEDAGLDDLEVDKRRPESILNFSKLYRRLILKQHFAENVFCPTGEGGGVDPICGKGEGRLQPYSIQKDRPYLNDEERKEYNKLFKRQQELYKKQKAGTITDAEAKESIDTKARLNRLSDIALGRKTKGEPPRESTRTKSKSKSDESKEVKSEGETPKFTRDQIRQIVEDNRRDPHRVSEFMARNSKAIGDVWTHGMSKPEYMHEMEVDGIKFQWGDTTRFAAAQSFVDSLAGTMPIHETLWKMNRAVTFTKQKNKEDGYWAKLYGLRGFEAAATGGDGTICVYGGRRMSPGTFAHESAHNLADKLGWKGADTDTGYHSPPSWTPFGKAQIAEKPVTEYAKTRPAEDFAETAMLYTTNPRYLQDRAPKKYAAMHDILERGWPWSQKKS